MIAPIHLADNHTMTDMECRPSPATRQFDDVALSTHENPDKDRRSQNYFREVLV